MLEDKVKLPLTHSRAAVFTFSSDFLYTNNPEDFRVSVFGLNNTMES